MTLDHFLNHAVPQFLYLENRDYSSDTIYLRGLNEESMNML